MPSQISIDEIPFLKRPAFASFTFPRYRSMLDGPAIDYRAICIGMSSDWEPAGLALLTPSADAAGAALLLSIFIRQDQRRRGLGTRLLQRAEEIAAARGFRELTAVHMTSLPEAHAFEALLRRAGWEPPRLRMYVLRSNLELINRSGWMRRPPALEPEYSLRPWAEVTEEEKLAAAAKSSYHPLIWPGNYPEDYDGHSSLAVRKSGELAGWIINHPMNPRLLRFTCSWLRADLQGRGRMAAVMAASIRRAGEGGYTDGSWTVPTEFPGMVAFARRRLFPYCTEVAETRGSSKKIS